MCHVRKADVRDVPRASGDDVARLDPRHRPADVAALRIRAQPHLSGDLTFDRRAPRTQFARERRSAAKQRRLLRDRTAAERTHIPRDLCGIAEHNAHALDRHVELVGDELRERGANPLPELDLPGERDHGPVRLDADALLDPLG